MTCTYCFSYLLSPFIDFRLLDLLSNGTLHFSFIEVYYIMSWLSIIIIITE